MREEYEKDKYNFLPSESNELKPTFQVDGVRFTYAQFAYVKCVYAHTHRHFFCHNYIY
jgi:hypothetical protein